MNAHMIIHRIFRVIHFLYLQRGLSLKEEVGKEKESFKTVCT